MKKTNKNPGVVDIDHLRTFYLSMGRALNASGLEEELGIGFRAFRWWLSGKRSLAEIHIEKVSAWARRYGYSIDSQYPYL